MPNLLRPIRFFLSALFLLPSYATHANPAPDAPTIRSIRQNDREIATFDILLHRTEVQKELVNQYNPEIEKQIPSFTLEASPQSLLLYSVFPDISRISRHGQGNFDAFQVEIEFPADLQSRAWPYLDHKETSFLVTWYDPENKSELNQATLIYKYVNASWRTVTKLNVPATNLPSGTRKLRGYPIVLALKDGLFVPPSELSQRYRFTPAPPNATDSTSVSLGLHFAAQNGFSDYFRTYIESFPKRKSPINKKLRDQYAYIAAKFGRTDTLLYFITIGTNPQQRVPDLRETTRDYEENGLIREIPTVRLETSNLIFKTLKMGQSDCTFALLESLQHEPKKFIRDSIVAKAMEYREFELANALLELGYPYKPATKARLENDRSNADILGYPELVKSIDDKFDSSQPN